jgi:hypothetical protein
MGGWMGRRKRKRGDAEDFYPTVMPVLSGSFEARKVEDLTTLKRSYHRMLDM